MNLLLKLVFFTAIGLMTLSAYPGRLGSLAFLAFFLAIPAFFLFILGLFVVMIWLACLPARSKQNLSAAVDSWGHSQGKVSRVWIVASALVVLACPLAIPVRIAFWISRPAFDRYLDPGAPAQLVGRDDTFDHRLGLYRVDSRSVDPRGGTYFRTHSGGHGIGPDVMSHGFAYRPNNHGTPYGRCGYTLTHLFGSWYRFQACDDYY